MLLRHSPLFSPFAMPLFSFFAFAMMLFADYAISRLTLRWLFR